MTRAYWTVCKPRAAQLDWPPMRLALELALARSVGRLSRLAGRGGGTTIPGKILATIDPGSVSTLAARLPRGTAAISATNGKTTTTALVAAIVGKRVRLAHNGSGANLVSGVASTLIEARDAELGLFEVDEGAFPEIARRIRPRAVCLGNLFRDQLDRYGELEQIAERWRAAVAELPEETTLVVNADDPRSAISPSLVRAASPSASTIRRRHARRSSTRPTRSTACAAGRRTSTPPPTSGTSATSAAPPAGMRDLRWTSWRERSSCTGSRRSRSTSSPRRARAGSGWACRGSTTSTTLSPPPRSRVRSARPSKRSHAGWNSPRRRSDAPSGSTLGNRRLLLLLIKNPAGANEVVRTVVAAEAPRSRSSRSTTRSPTAATSPGSGTSTSSRCSSAWSGSSSPAARAAELALRFTYAGFPQMPSRSSPSSAPPSTAGSS